MREIESLLFVIAMLLWFIFLEVRSLRKYFKDE